MENKIMNKVQLSGSQKPEISKSQEVVKAAHLYSNPINGKAAASEIAVPVFVDANFVAGRLYVGVYHMAEHSLTEGIYFNNAANAFNYAFLLKKRHGITIARRAFDLIRWAIVRTGAVSSRAMARAAAEAPAAPEAPAERHEPEQPAKPSKAPKPKTAPDMLKQYEEMKTKHPDAIILFRVSDFYECFSEDAVTASEILGITLTTRTDSNGDKVFLAGFPHHSLDTYLPRLVRAGQRVAICEQLENHKKKASRKVTATPVPASVYDK